MTRLPHAVAAATAYSAAVTAADSAYSAAVTAGPSRPRERGPRPRVNRVLSHRMPLARGQPTTQSLVDVFLDTWTATRSDSLNGENRNRVIVRSAVLPATQHTTPDLAAVWWQQIICAALFKAGHTTGIKKQTVGVLMKKALRERHKDLPNSGWTSKSHGPHTKYTCAAPPPSPSPPSPPSFPSSHRRAMRLFSRCARHLVLLEVPETNAAAGIAAFATAFGQPPGWQGKLTLAELGELERLGEVTHAPGAPPPPPRSSAGPPSSLLPQPAHLSLTP